MTVTGVGEITLTGPTTTAVVEVTAPDKVAKKEYTVYIYRERSNNAKIVKIKPSSKTLVPIFDSEVLEYTVEVPDEVDKISFEVTTESKFATVYGNEERPIYYAGDIDENHSNTFEIYAEAEDGTRSPTYVINVIRVHDLQDIVLPDTISIGPSSTLQLKPEFIPEDATYKDLEFVSLNKNIVTVDENGLITSYNILDTAQLIVRSKTYPEITKMINVVVEITQITSSVYEVKRDDEAFEMKDGTKINYITMIPLKIKLSEFISNLDNAPEYLHIYDQDGNEITDLNNNVTGTGLKVTLESNGYTYDSLDIVVLGDINGDGLSDVQDITLIKNHILRKTILDGIELLAGDINIDSYSDVQDLTLVKNYILRKITSYLS